MLEFFKKGIYVFIFLAISFLLPTPLSAKELPPLLERSRYYREKGFEFQSQGRLEEAIVCYQKAIMLDPTYTVAYNDLGIVYEAKGMDEKAEEAYLAGLKTDPNYPNLYTNLAMLCEKKKDYASAARFWKKRIELGPPGDVWVKKAQERLVALREFVPELLAEEVAEMKRNKRLKELAEINRLYGEAKRLYQAAEYEKALNCINLALNLNPNNKQELLSFRQELEKKARIAEMQRHFQNAMRYYEKNDLQEAKRELERISAVITSSLKDN